MAGSLSASEERAAVAGRYDLARAFGILLISVVTGLVVGLLLLPHSWNAELGTGQRAIWQDIPLTPIFICAGLLRPALSSSRSRESAISSVAALALAVTIILLAGAIGRALIFHNFDLSRDEQMAVFDQQIFAHGRLFWPIPADWRVSANALNRRFMLPIGSNEYWVSGYLPMHSAYRALLGRVGLANLASAIMTAIAAVALWAIARRLWPQSSRTVVLSLVLFVTSSQVLIMAMTAFSMSMHLALNLVWLALFLRDRRWSHLLAILVAFVATGIHQPLFHPLFAMPFVALLAFEQRGRLLAFYVAAYGLIGLFWLAWPLWIVSHGVGPVMAITCGPAGNCSSPPGFAARLMGAVTTFNVTHVWLTAANVLRFVCWQHPLLVPLALFGTMSCWRSDPFVKALAVSFLLPIVVMAIILPWQGQGWGYRYVHQVLGNAILLAAYGFNRLEVSGLTMRRPLILATAAAIVLVPIHGWLAARAAAPFIEIHDDLAAIPSDVVIVDTDKVPFGQDVVFNAFDLSNRPKLLVAALLTPKDLASICKRSTIAFFDGPRMAPIARVFHWPPPSAASAEIMHLHQIAQADGCRILETQATHASD